MLVFFIIIILINLIIYFSTITIKIDNLKIDSRKKQDNNNYKIIIYLILAKKVKWLKFEINKEKTKNQILEKILNKIFNPEKIKNLKWNNLNKNNPIIFKIIKNRIIKLEKLEVRGRVGLNNVIVLSYLVALLNIFFSLLIAKHSLNSKLEKYNYSIEPHQTDKFYIKLSINCIISIKIANIINMIIKKRSEEINERTSYRKFNGNSNAKYPRYG